MVVMHIRTVATMASISTTVQCFLWIIGYILYMVAYGCGYKSTYFSSQAGKKLPTDLSNYFIWYLQDFNCTTSSTWIDSVRNQSSDLLVTMFSIGLSINCILLSTSLFLLTGLHSQFVSQGLRYKMFSYSVFLVSIWDMILVIIIARDIAPLLEPNQYLSQNSMFSPNSTQPSIMAMPFFIEVFTVIMLLVSRFFFFWFLNIVAAVFLLVKDINNVVTSSPSSPVPQTIPDTLRGAHWDRKMASPDVNFFPTDGLKRQMPLPPLIPGYDDDVRRRWNENERKDAFVQPFSHGDGEGYQSIESGNSTFDNRSVISEEKWNEAEIHIRDTVQSWENGDLAGRRPMNLEGRTSTERMPSRSGSFAQRMRFSMSKKPSFRAKAKIEKTPPPKKQVFPFSQPGGKPFKAKPKRVAKPSTPDCDGEPVPAPGTDGNTNSPYLITPIWNPVPSTSAQVESRNDPPPLPPLPPLQGMPPLRPTTSKAGLIQQMSIAEAIKTRRPLKPINRPPIDTSC